MTHTPNVGHGILWAVLVYNTFYRFRISSKIKFRKTKFNILGKGMNPPYPPSYGLNSTTTVLLGEWLWH